MTETRKEKKYEGWVVENGRNGERLSKSEMFG